MVIFTFKSFTILATVVTPSHCVSETKVHYLTALGSCYHELSYLSTAFSSPGPWRGHALSLCHAAGFSLQSPPHSPPCYILESWSLQSSRSLSWGESALHSSVWGPRPVVGHTLQRGQRALLARMGRGLCLRSDQGRKMMMLRPHTASSPLPRS